MHLRRKELLNLLEHLQSFVVKHKRLPKEKEWRKRIGVPAEHVEKYGGIKWLAARLILRLSRVGGWDEVDHAIEDERSLPPTMTVKQTADYLQVSTETIKRYIRDERISAFKLEREWRIRKEDLVDFINRRTYGISDFDPVP